MLQQPEFAVYTDSTNVTLQFALPGYTKSDLEVSCADSKGGTLVNIKSLARKGFKPPPGSRIVDRYLALYDELDLTLRVEVPIDHQTAKVELENGILTIVSRLNSKSHTRLQIA